MKNFFPLLFCFLFLQTIAYGQGKNYEFSNGHWFNGRDFTDATWYSVGGKLSKKAPPKIDSVIDLSNRWVIPPFGDANCASVADNSNAANVLKMYLGEGVYYLRITGNTQEGRKTVEPMLDKPTTPDAAWSNGALTCSLGYPFVKYEGPAIGIKSPIQWGQQYDKIKVSQKMLGDGYWFMDNKTALDANWKKIEAQKPSFIAIYLVDAEKNGGKESKGLTADMAKMIVKKAHKSKLQVIAHVDNADDLRLGLKLGVDGFANLPGSDWDGNGDASRYALSDDDLKKLAKKETPVVPLLSHSQTLVSRKGALEANAKLLKRLLDNGVNVAIGSDDPQRTIRSELNYWYAMGAQDNLQVLKILCENTPRAIFPKRKIAKIADGYEASFLVLDENPLQNLLKARAAIFKVKQGVILP